MKATINNGSQKQVNAQQFNALRGYIKNIFSNMIFNSIYEKTFGGEMSNASVITDKTGLYPPSMNNKIIKFDNLPSKALESGNIQSILVVAKGYMHEKLRIDENIIKSLSSSIVPKEVKEKFVSQMKAFGSVGIDSSGLAEKIMTEIVTRLRMQDMDVVNINVMPNIVEIKQHQITKVLDQLTGKFKADRNMIASMLLNSELPLAADDLAFEVNAFLTIYAPKSAFIEYKERLDKWMYENNITWEDIEKSLEKVEPLTALKDTSMFVTESENKEIAELTKELNQIKPEFEELNEIFFKGFDKNLLNQILSGKVEPKNKYQERYKELYLRIKEIEDRIIELKHGKVYVTNLEGILSN